MPAGHGNSHSAVVARVIDGDTLELVGGEKVRLIGVDTPETVHPSRPVEAFGKEASAFTRSALEGEAIRLEYDQANAAGGHRDRYGRILAYVYRERDGLDFNAELVHQGFAHAYTNYPFRRMEEFRRYEREAREAGRGLWGAADTTVRGSQSTEEDSTVYVTRTGSKFHRSNCRYLKSSKIPLKLSEAKVRYTPCSVCGPTAYESRSTERPAVRAPPPGEDQTVEQTVYVTRTGKKYHRGGCRYLRRSRIPMKLSAARIRYGPCSVCGPPR